MVWGVGLLISIMIARWSEMVRLMCGSCSIWMLMDQTRGFGFKVCAEEVVTGRPYIVSCAMSGAPWTG